ncbi:MAG TPA: N-acetylmuramoyl-L-alanine amidase, partial [Candidatus Limnocylindrales bacterium]
VELPFGASDVTLHWHGNPDAKVSIQLASEPGAWGEVIPVAADEGGLGGAGRDEDVGSTAPATDAETFGAVIWSAGARYVRVTADRPLGKVTVVGFQSDGPPRMVIAHDDATSTVSADVGAPAIISRHDWGANESYRFNDAGDEKWPVSYFPLQVLIVHHTAGRNNDPNPEATIRAIYYDDAVLRDWGDMGYNFLIDAQGHIYEGRHARAYGAGELHDEENAAGNVARGAHAKGYNSGSLGIVLLGTFDTVLPTTAARSSLEKLLAWESERHGINPTTASTYVNPDLGTTKLLNHISGHRNVNNTDCPGADFYPTFPTMRTSVASRMTATEGAHDTTPPSVAAFSPMATDPTGGTTIDFGLTFSEAVTGLTADDFSIAGTSSGWSVKKVAGAGVGWTITVSATDPPEGSVELDLAADAVTDLGSHTGPTAPASATASYAHDTTAPTMSITYTPHTSATNKELIDASVTFSEPVVGLTAADIAVGGTSNHTTNWVVDPVVGSGAHWAFTLEKHDPADGTLTIQIPAGVTTDPAGNPNEASALRTFVIDRTKPTTSAPGQRLRSGLPLSTTVPVSVTWAGSDGSIGSGIATYDVARSVDGAAFTTFATGLTSPSFSTTEASGHSYRFEVRARDKAGNVGSWVAGATIHPSLLQQSSSSIHYLGTWSPTLTSSAYSGGSVRYATAAGATASLTTSARGLAFVTTRGPTRGAVKVYIDGALKATIDLQAATTQYRYVAYAIGFSSLGTHTIRIVVVGTAGRPRVDLDAFEILR